MAEPANKKQDQAVKRTKHRSPNYPSFGLRKAVELAKAIDEKYRRAKVPINLAHELWKYKPHSGAGNQAVAALKSFGLIAVEGGGEDRQIQLTEDAIHILRAGPNHAKLLKEAALKPPIYNELWTKYEGDPNDSLMGHYLVWERVPLKFNPDVVDDFIADFRDSLTFAKLSAGDIIDPADEMEDVGKFPAAPGALAHQIARMREKDKVRDRRESLPSNQQRRPPMQPGAKEATLPLDTGAVYITWPENISPEEIEDVENWMELMIRKMKRSAEPAKTAGNRWADDPDHLHEDGEKEEK